MSSETRAGFDQLGLAPQVLQAVREVGYETPSPIQLAAIKPLLEGRDLIGQAQTGTGKTAAFALPALSRIDLKKAHPQVLVLAPTRELAIQVAEAMQTYARHLKGFHVLPVYGGQGMDLQLRQLRRGVHAVVGTPGRVQDHLRRGTLKLGALRTVVIDEADEMLRMGFIDDVEEILAHMPDRKQVALFSATMPPAIRKIAGKYLSDPVEVKIQSQTATVARLRQRYWLARGMNKLDALTRILEAEEFDAMLVFVRTRISTTELAEKLEARGFASAALNGDMTQAMREQVVDRLRKGKLDIVVATDVAARGLDVDRISHVINFDIPHDTEAYVHRVGRTGRAGREGQAILFVAPRERRMLGAIERATRQRIEPMEPPTREDVSERRLVQFKDRVTETLGDQDLAFFEELIADLASESGQTPERIAAALAYQMQEVRPLQFLGPAPVANAGYKVKSSPSQKRGRPQPQGPSTPPRREARSASRSDEARPKPQHKHDRADHPGATRTAAKRSDGPVRHDDARQARPARKPMPGETGAAYSDRKPQHAHVQRDDSGDIPPARKPVSGKTGAAQSDRKPLDAHVQRDDSGEFPPARKPESGETGATHSDRKPQDAHLKRDDSGDFPPARKPATAFNDRKRRDPPRYRDPVPVPKGRVRYRIAVGRDHGVLPKNIVGAIANEADLDPRHIGHIGLHETYSTVDLPSGMPDETFQQVGKAVVCGQKLDLKREPNPPRMEKKPVKPRKPKKSTRPAKPGKPKRFAKSDKPFGKGPSKGKGGARSGAGRKSPARKPPTAKA